MPEKKTQPETKVADPFTRPAPKREETKPVEPPKIAEPAKKAPTSSKPLFGGKSATNPFAKRPGSSGGMGGQSPGIGSGAPQTSFGGAAASSTTFGGGASSTAMGAKPTSAPAQ